MKTALIAFSLLVSVMIPSSAFSSDEIDSVEINVDNAISRICKNHNDRVNCVIGIKILIVNIKHNDDIYFACQVAKVTGEVIKDKNVCPNAEKLRRHIDEIAERLVN